MFMNACFFIYPVFLPIVHQYYCLIKRIHLLLLQLCHINSMLYYLIYSLITFGSSLILRFDLPGASRSLMLSLYISMYETHTLYSLFSLSYNVLKTIVILTFLMPLNMSLTAQGSIPGISCVPSIVYVLPLVVCPYMKTVPL